MNRKNLFVTLTAALVISAIGVAIDQSQQGSVDFDSPLILPELAQNAAKLNHIRIASAGNALVVESKKQQDKWVISNLGGYNADIPKLAALLNNLKDARKVEAKTAKPALFHHLGLRDIVDAQSKALLVSLTDGDNTYQLLIGSSAKNGSGQYVRLAGDNQTWLIDKAIDRPEKPEDWVNTGLFDFTLADIQSVSVAGKYRYDLSKADKEQQSYQFADIPDGHKLKYDAIVDAIPRSISSLAFEQLLPIGQWQAGEAGDALTLEVKLFDLRRLTLTLTRAADKHYVQLKGDNVLWDKWAYRISEYHFNQLVKDQMEFFDVIEGDVETAP